MTDFEERSGRISQKTEWGNWSQSLHDVTIEVDLEKVSLIFQMSLFIMVILGHSRQGCKYTTIDQQYQLHCQEFSVV